MRAVIKNVETYLGKQDRWKMPNSDETPMVTSYRPELYVSPVLGPHNESYYIPLIGILRWIVELGRV